MNSSVLTLLGAFDALIAIIQNEREALSKTFDPEPAVQTLKKVQAEFLQQMLASSRAQAAASDTFRATVAQLLTGIPQGSDLESAVRTLESTVIMSSPEGPTPPWPSSSSSED